MLIERFIEDPHHIEIQVIADTHGNVVAFPERYAAFSLSGCVYVVRCSYRADATRCAPDVPLIELVRYCTVSLCELYRI
jgi:biotin carboxylase